MWLARAELLGRAPIRLADFTAGGATVLVIVILLAPLWQGGLTDESLGAKQGSPVWIVPSDRLAALQKSNTRLARQLFDNPRTYVMGEAGDRRNPVPKGYSSVAAIAYTSAGRFKRDVRAHRVVSGVDMVMYHPDNWPRTPAAERRDPLSAMARFKRVARRSGMTPMVAPGRELMRAHGGVCTKHTGEWVSRAYLRCGMTTGAYGAAIFVVHTAADEVRPEAFRGLLGAANDQLRGSAPGAETIATLSTRPPGAKKKLRPADLMRAAKIALAYADGIMLDFTADTTAVAAGFLRRYDRWEPAKAGRGAGRL